VSGARGPGRSGPRGGGRKKKKKKKKEKRRVKKKAVKIMYNICHLRLQQINVI